MVVFVDLGDDDDASLRAGTGGYKPSASQQLRALRADREDVIYASTTTSSSGHALREAEAGAEEGMAAAEAEEVERPNPNINGFSAALSCYPVVRSLATNLDLNDLHSLSRTCRQFRVNFLGYHQQLRSNSLRCENDIPPPSRSACGPTSFNPGLDNGGGGGAGAGADMTDEDLRACLEAISFDSPPIFPGSSGSNSHYNNGSGSGGGGGRERHWKPRPGTGTCARDLVAECRRCGVVVCRNCAVKPPSTRLLQKRHRRLCGVCVGVKIEVLMLPITKNDGTTEKAKDKDNNRAVEGFESSASGDSSTRSSQTPSYSSYSSSTSSTSISSTLNHLPQSHSPSPPTSAPQTFTTPAFQHTPCHCSSPPSGGVHLCRPCGLSLRSDDLTYQRVWEWRSRYSSHIGAGLGTGMGEGDQGQKCGREEECLAAVEREVEVEEEVGIGIGIGNGNGGEFVGEGEGSAFPGLGWGSAMGSMVPVAAMATATATAMPFATEYSPAAGYLRQEVIGIGGSLMRKVKKRVRIGATVWEFDDERDTGKYLERESSGRERSWCGWCRRVILSERDRRENGEEGWID